MASISPPVRTEPTPVADPAGWSHLLDFIEKLGRSHKEARARVQALEAQVKTMASEADAQRASADARIATLEAEVETHAAHAQQLEAKLQDAEHWLHRIQAALKAQTELEAAPPAQVELQRAVEHWRDPAR